MLFNLNTSQTQATRMATTRQGKISGLGPLRKIPVSANAVQIAVSAKNQKLNAGRIAAE